MILIEGAFDDDNLNLTENFLFIYVQLVHLDRKIPSNSTNALPSSYDSNSIDYSENDNKIYKIPIIEDIDSIDSMPEVRKYLTINLSPQMFNQLQTERTELQLRISTNIPVSLPVRLAYNLTPIDKTTGVIYAAIVLLGLYIMIIWEIVHRTFAAMIASTMSIALLAMMNERPTMPELMSWIDIETLLLLFGMMILVAILSETGIFDYLAVYAYKVSLELNYCVLKFNSI